MGDEYTNARRMKARKAIDAFLRRHVAILHAQFKESPEQIYARVLARTSGRRTRS
jgi:hypothetical protein